MFGTDVVIESSCRVCGAAIEIGTAQDGKSLSYAQPVNAVVWYDLAYSGCVAASCCRSIAFYCSEAELQPWVQLRRHLITDVILTRRRLKSDPSSPGG